jgi:hypothetical protein
MKPVVAWSDYGKIPSFVATCALSWLVAACTARPAEHLPAAEPARPAVTTLGWATATPTAGAPPASVASATPAVAVPGKGECADGIDNDGDGLVDWMSDLGCTGRDDATEGGKPSGTLEHGFTVLEQGRGGRIIYVSSSEGNDANGGFAPRPNGSDGPKRTLAGGAAALRSGQPDWLLLRRGDRWHESLVLASSGRSPSEPLVIAGYGPSLELPLVEGTIDGKNLDNVVVANLHLRFSGRDTGMVGFTQTSHVLIEGLLMDGGADCIGGVGTSAMLDWRVRRNVCVRAWNGGAYFEWVHGLLLEDNVIYRPGAYSDNHAFYIARRGNADVVTRGNIILMDKPKGDGITQRPGGLSEGTVVVAADWQGINLGACNDGDEPKCYPKVPVVIRGNLLLDGKKLGGGISIDCPFALPGAEVSDNIVANARPESLPAVTTCSPDMVFRRNVLYDARIELRRGGKVSWLDNTFYGTRAQPLVVVDDPNALAQLTARGNRYFSRAERKLWFDMPGPGDFAVWQKATGETGNDRAVTFADPERTLAKYNASLGGAPEREAFFLETIRQTRLFYRDAYGAPAVIAYFREGLGRPRPDAAH